MAVPARHTSKSEENTNVLYTLQIDCSISTI